MALVVWHDSARRHLLKIFEYNIDNISEKFAYSILRAMLGAVHALERAPRKGAPESLLQNRKFEYRHLIVRKHYKVIYFIDNNECHIVAIWDVRQNPQTLIATIVH